MYRFYSKPTSGTRVTVVGEHKDGMLNLATAVCSRKDNFVKRKGRAIAEGRFSKGKYTKSIPMNKCDGKEFVKQASVISEEVSVTKQIYSNG